MTIEEIIRLAKAINDLRPAWPMGSVHAFITDKLVTRTFLEAAIPLVWVAVDSDTRTPGRCLEAGPWNEAIQSRRPTVIPDPLCEICHRRHDPDRPNEHPRPTVGPTADYLAARAATRTTPPQEHP